MSRGPLAPVRAAAALVLAPALALALAGCGAGFEAQTYQERAVADVANGAVGAIALRGLQIAPGGGGELTAGSDVLVRMTLVNNGADDDELTGADSPLASTVDLVEMPGEREASSVPVPALGTTGSTAALVLRGVSKDLRPGDYVEVTLSFERNGEKTVRVPVATTGRYDDSRERSENFHQPGEHAEGE